jgi:hypothetical protein
MKWCHTVLRIIHFIIVSITLEIYLSNHHKKWN